MDCAVLCHVLCSFAFRNDLGVGGITLFVSGAFYCAAVRVLLDFVIFSLGILLVLMHSFTVIVPVFWIGLSPGCDLSKWVPHRGRADYSFSRCLPSLRPFYRTRPAGRTEFFWRWLFISLRYRLSFQPINTIHFLKKKSFKNPFKISSKSLQNPFKIPLKFLENVSKIPQKSLQNLFKTLQNTLKNF